MWAGGDDWSDQGEQIRLYLPTLYAKNKAIDPTRTSFIGGESPDLQNDNDAPPCCSICQAQMYLLVHLIAPKRSNDVEADRCMQVFACNQASCMSRVLEGNALCYGGGGTVVCRRRKLVNSTTTGESDVVPVAKEAKNDDNDWNVVKDDSVDDLEAKLAAMEASTINRNKPTKQERPSVKSFGQHSTSNNRSIQFPSFPLTSLLEPPSERLHAANDDDDDDVGMSTGTSDDKIQAMLAKYMAEEEDEGILSALRGVGADGGSGGKERDERLSASERALLAYSDRLKRSPRQVLRYAYGGVPMWSIPLSTAGQNDKVTKHTLNASNKKGTVQEIPPCSCGASRVFEFQILPSLLHVLEVDKHADTPADNTSNVPLTGLQAAFAQSGMNFGNIAVYTCSKACDGNAAEYVVLQDSVDEAPRQRMAAAGENEAVVIAEGTQFEDVDDDASDAMNDNDEDDGDFDVDDDDDNAFQDLK
ncbi:hypothetical protein MPSEU_000953900 [Mayamaea pseudoterrestris]|nr:hypothetical protein MPSEU_000953900 [Mayamaea pseudoterrestris]